MEQDASDRTLGIINIWQVLRKLHWEIELVKEIPDKIEFGIRPVNVLHVQDAKLYASINAASTALALVDWLYHSIRQDEVLILKLQQIFPGIRMTEDKHLLDDLRKFNPAINACHQICNSNKHFHLRKIDEGFKALVMEIVTINEDGEKDLSVVSRIIRNRNDPAAATSVLEMLEGVAEWWEKLLADLDLPSREDFFPASSHRQQAGDAGNESAYPCIG